MNLIYACSKHDTRGPRAGRAQRTARSGSSLRIVSSSYTNLTCGCLLGVVVPIVSLGCKCVTSTHTRHKCSPNWLRHNLQEAPCDAFLFYFISKSEAFPAFTLSLPSLDGTGYNLRLVVSRRCHFCLRETEIERPINATRHQQEAAQINIPPSIICGSKFCLSFCLSPITGGYPSIYAFPVKAARSNNWVITNNYCYWAIWADSALEDFYVCVLFEFCSIV